MDILAVLEDADREVRDSRHDLAAILDDPYKFREFVFTEFEDDFGEEKRNVIKQYPKYKFLCDYRDAYRNHELTAVPKARGMLATTDPLVDSLWECVRVAHRGGVWRTAIVRQSQDTANSLILRVKGIWSRLPVSWRPELEIDNLNQLRFKLKPGVFGEAMIRALNSEGDVGRGDPWDLVILDEGAAQRYLAKNIGAFAARTRRIVVPSTVNGNGCEFAHLCDGKTYPGRFLFEMPHYLHPDRIPGTPSGDAYIALMQRKMSVVDFLREIKMRRDVFSEPGWFQKDFDPQCIVDGMEYDGGPITVSFDPGFVKGAAVVSFINKHRQDCAFRVFLAEDELTDEFAMRVFEWCKDRMSADPDSYRIAGDPAAKQRKSTSRRVGNSVLTDASMIEQCFKEVFKESARFQCDKIAADDRRDGHKAMRQMFKMRQDGRFGTLINRQGCQLLIEGFEGEYRMLKPEGDMTADDFKLERPYRNCDHCHVMDARRYGIMQFLKASPSTSIYQKSKMEVKKRVATIASCGTLDMIMGREKKKGWA